MAALIVVLTILTVHRATRLLVEDEILDTPRMWLAERLEDGHPKLVYLMTCPWCLSIWAGAAIVLVVDVVVGLPVPVLVWAAASSVTGLLASWE